MVPKAVRGQRAVRAPAVCAPVVRDDDDGCRRATDNLRDGFCFIRLARGGGRRSGPSDSVCPCQILIAPISSDKPPPILADW